MARQLDRKLGFGSVFSISVGAMLGSGIFVLPGLAAGLAGPWVSADYDLLVLGAHPERALLTLFFHHEEHRISEAAHCSVIKVKAPRHTVHSRFDMPIGSSSPFGRNLQSFLTWARGGSPDSGRRAARRICSTWSLTPTPRSTPVSPTWTRPERRARSTWTPTTA